MAERIPNEVRDARRAIARLVNQRSAALAAQDRLGAVDPRQIDGFDADIGALLDGVAALIDPCDASEVDPLVLLPVRLETRFDSAGQQTELKVRIYPDEVHLDDLQRGVSAAERAAGEAYWTAAWTDPLPPTAWADLVAAVGADRAEWVAHARTPTNLAERGTGVPSFGPVAEAGVRNVTARALPDRFVVIAVSGDTVSRAVGRPIPRDLMMSPIPLAGDAPERVANALTLPPGAEWLVDYDEAVAKGMAVTVQLDSGTAPLDRVLAIGTRPSASAADGAAELEALLTGHRFRAGLSWLRQGSPTNNADAARSPYRPRREPAPPEPQAAAVPEASDSALAAGLLGVDAGTLARLVGAGNGEQAIARAVNTALWAPGWGEFLARLDEQGVPGVVDAQRESARQLFRDHVRGRGAAPALQVGAQAYGILPVSDLAAWVPQAGETTTGIHAVVGRLLQRWLVAALRQVPTVRTGSARLDEALLEVMGSSPVMQGLRARPVLTDDVSGTVLAALGIDHREYEAERISVRAIGAALLGEDGTKLAAGSLHEESRPVPLPLAAERDLEFIDALLETPSRVLAVDSVLQALLVLALDSADAQVTKTIPATVMPNLLDFVELEPRLKATVSAAVARADDAPASELAAAAHAIVATGVEPSGAAALRHYEPIERFQTSLAEVALSAPPTAEAKLLAKASLAGWLVAMGYRGEIRDAMRQLAGTASADRALAVAEALDCSSHRLDAWATAIVADRRARQVAAAGGAPRGCTIGAYGVVEDLAPQPGATSDGWIHAPSPRHAVMAGMLRAAHLSHLPTGGAASGGGPFAIDLSSGRMRAVSHILEGVRHGQQLGALIGYQIERGLAEAGLTRLQLSLRTLAPLVARRLSDGDGRDDKAAQESIAANTVVDGVLLLSRFAPGDTALRAQLDVAPANPYLEPGDWQPLTDGQWNAVTRVVRAAADAIDAVADAMLSESVLQFAGGNATRAAAALDAMSSGASPSDTLDVLEVPDRGERLTHRVLALVGPGATAGGWNANRPRARVEPSLEAWAATHLGDATDIVVAVDGGGNRITLDATGFAALDLVFATDLVALERRLRATMPDLTGRALAVERDPAWPARTHSIGQAMGLAATLRALLAGSHPLTPADVTRPGETPRHDLSAGLAELGGRVSALAAEFVNAVAVAAPVVAAIPADGIVASEAEAEAAAAAVEPLDRFGVVLEPVAARPLDLAWARSAWQAADACAKAATELAKQLAQLPADTPPSLVLDAAQAVVAAVYGDGFLVVPTLIAPAAADPLASAVTDPAFPAPPPSAVRRFVRDHGTVRTQVSRLSEVLLVAGALGSPASLTVAQLSGLDDQGGPAPGTDRWLCGPLGSAAPWPTSPVAHLTMDVVGSIDAGVPVAGLVLDAWVEDLPGQVGPNADPADPRPNRARTGLAVRANGASARPPQAILCAISPDRRRWTTDALRAVVEQTLDLARVRLVTLERLAGEGLILPALYTRSSSLQGEQYLALDKLAALADVRFALPYVKELQG